MSYKNLLDTQLRRAFTLAKDLAQDATFTVKTSGTFDFGTAVPAEDTGLPIVAKIIVYDGETRKGSKSSDSDRRTVNFLVRAKEVPDLKGFDSVEFDGFKWQIGAILKGTGYIYVAEALRGGV